MNSNLPAPYLIADHRGMELINTLGAPYGEMLDWLKNGQEMLAWMVAVDLVSEADAQRLQGSIPGAELDGAAEALRDFRKDMQANLPEAGPAFLAQINDVLSAGRGHYEIDTDAEGARMMRFQPLLETAEDLVVLVVVEVAALFCLNTPERMRKCDSPTCTYWFHDTTRNNRRRWCSMAVCGNRAKVKAHRARQ